MIVSKKINVSEFWSILLLLCVMFESIVNKLLITVLPIDNLLGYVMLFVAAMVVLTNRLYLNRWFMLLYVGCWLLLSLSALFIGGSAVGEYIFQFVSFGSCGVLCAMTYIDIMKFFKAGAVATIIFIMITYIQNFTDAQISPFAFGYALIPGWIVTFYNVYNEKRECKYWRVGLWFCAFLLETVCLIRFCSRGNLVQIYVFAIICIMVLFHKKILGFLGIAAALLGVIFIEPIIIMLNQIMETLGVSVSVIEKSYWLLTTSSESLLHGRMELFEDIFKEIDVWNIPFGRGIGAYENLIGTYTHNIFSQAFSELGLIGLILIGMVFIFFIKIMNDSTNNYYETEFYIMLFVIVLIKLFFSSVYWRTSAFWFLVGIIYKKMGREKVKVMIKV